MFTSGSSEINGRSKSGRFQRTRTIAPRCGNCLFFKEILAPDRASSVFAMKNPRPSPGISRPRIRRPRALVTYGSPMRSMISGGKPDPSSLTSTTTLSSVQVAVTWTRSRAKSTAFSRMFQPVQNRGIARPDGLTRIVLGNLDLDGHARPAVRRYHFLDQGRQLHPLERLAGGR